MKCPPASAAPRPFAAKTSLAPHRAALAASIALLLASVPSLSAQTLVWDADPATAGIQSGNGKWDAGNFWWNGTANVPWTSGFDATFGVLPGLSTGNVDVGGMTVDDIFFTAVSSYNLFSSAGTLNLGGGEGPHVISGGGSGSTFPSTISANISGTGDVVVSGGTMIFQRSKLVCRRYPARSTVYDEFPSH